MAIAAAARQKLQALLADAPADAPWRQTVADRLAELSSNREHGGFRGTSPAAGPTAQDVAAAQSMTPEQRQAMIRGMVERLAQRLEQHPDDKAGWERLARAYDVLGETDKAQSARAHAAAAGDADATGSSVCRPRRLPLGRLPLGRPRQPARAIPRDGSIAPVVLKGRAAPRTRSPR